MSTIRRNAKLSQEQADEIRERVDAGEKQNALAREYGVSNASISKIVNGHSYSDNPKPAKTVDEKGVPENYDKRKSGTRAGSYRRTDLPCSPSKFPETLVRDVLMDYYETNEYGDTPDAFDVAKKHGLQVGTVLHLVREYGDEVMLDD